jgi:2-isopropylmalate synthase
VFLATSDIHMKYKLRMEPEEVLRRAVEGGKAGQKPVQRCGIFLRGCQPQPPSSSTGAGGGHRGRSHHRQHTRHGGVRCPEEFGRLIGDQGENVPNIDKAVISVHCHDDLGIAVANTLSAIENGARQIETTINGLGERAGNCSMEEVVMALTTRSGFTA